MDMNSNSWLIIFQMRSVTLKDVEQDKVVKSIAAHLKK